MIRQWTEERIRLNHLMTGLQSYLEYFFYFITYSSLDYFTNKSREAYYTWVFVAYTEEMTGYQNQEQIEVVIC